MKINKSFLAGVALSIGLIMPASVMAVGAIAVDDEAGDVTAGYALVTGYDSKAAAQAAAIKECREAGNKNCKAVLWFETCGAYAADAEHYGIGFGKSIKIAESKAIEDCGGGSCKPIVSDCE